MGLPHNDHRLVDKDGRITPEWRRALDTLRIATATNTASGGGDSGDEDVLSADTSISAGEGITVIGRLRDGNVTISLRELADSGVGGALWKFTRDDFGRVEGTEAATAEDLAYVDLMGYGLANVQTALQTALGVRFYIGDTAPDPALFSSWIDSSDTGGMGLSVWYDDGTSAQWVGIGGGVSGGTEGMCPYYLLDETYTVPIYKQVLFSETIDVDGDAVLAVDGLLLEVN